MNDLINRMRLFLGIVWREWEPRSCGIPDPYRSTYRIAFRDAARIAFTMGRR
jgi:hypothetical protein